MNAAFLITFREGLEAAMIIGILLSTLEFLNAYKHRFFIWGGVLLGLVGSVLFAWIFHTFFGDYSGTNEKIYEGILMTVAAGIIVHLVFWMKQYAKNIRENIKNKVKFHIERNELIALGTLAFVSVAREGIETVIFLNALWVQSEGSVTIVSAFLGILAAVLLAFGIFKGSKKVSIGYFFQGTTLLLVFVAAGLIAHAVVEFQGAQLIPTIQKPIYDLSSVISEEEGIGSFLKALFGYDANPSLIAVIAYISVLFWLLPSMFIKKKK